ncbi:cytochrome c4 [Candidimonas sp. SYP-B2681]|uniref:c-type cytochrome n=1 Tax=Candidimonas sp. SYP-B2681 TaxID=2497686 RepID=UPI000F8703C8|nr:c-type cytochrome [Candidimonas sp. SYP-B2681]RTZ39242.1 cytochrome c4 [Candidimonas sp. SYP-B2681]
MHLSFSFGALLSWKAVLLAAFFSGLTSGAQAQNISAKLMRCVACHGADGNSQQEGVPSLASQPKIFIENQLVMIREGMRNIPIMQGVLDGVTDEELTAMATHYAALPLTSPPADRQQSLYVMGEKLAREMRCGTCHLPNYVGREQMPRLAGQREDYLLQSMRQFKSNQAVGRDTIMAAALYGASDDDIKALAYFMSRTTP